MDRDEFSERVRAVQERLYRISYGHLHEPQDRQDAVQEAIFKAWRNCHRLRNPAFFETWLIRILINECHNRQRAQRRLVPVEVLPERADEAEEDHAELREAVLSLPEKLRLPIMLHYIEGYKTDEIARILCIPTGTVRSRLKRARSALKELLEQA